MAAKGVSMPGYVNNLDVTVSANSIFATTASILSGLVKPEVLDDPLIRVSVIVTWLTTPRI
jgi:hypothetical protein